MMIKRSTWFILLILVFVMVAYFLTKNRPEIIAEETPTTTASSFIVTDADGLLTGIRIYDFNNHTIQMQRDTNGVWNIVLPDPGVADQGLAGAAEAQVGALRIVSILEIPPALSDLGLINPAYRLEFGFDSRTIHKLNVGNLTPTNSGYYAQYDDGIIYIISQAGIDSLLNLLTTPPYPATPTPTMEPTLSPTPESATPTSS